MSFDLKNCSILSISISIPPYFARFSRNLCKKLKYFPLPSCFSTNYVAFVGFTTWEYVIQNEWQLKRKNVRKWRLAVFISLVRHGAAITLHFPLTWPWSVQRMWFITQFSLEPYSVQPFLKSGIYTHLASQAITGRWPKLMAKRDYRKRIASFVT